MCKAFCVWIVNIFKAFCNQNKIKCKHRGVRIWKKRSLSLSRPLDVNYVLDQGHGHLSKYLISGLIFHFFRVYVKKKTSNPSLKKRSLDVSLQHKNRASNKFSKKNLLYLAENRASAERVKASCNMDKIRFKASCSQE